MSEHDALCHALALALSSHPGAEMTQLAQAAGVSRATLYRLFGNREALILTVARYALHHIDTLTAPVGQDAQSYREVFEALMETLVQAGPVGRFLGHLDAAIESQLADQIARQEAEMASLVREAQQAGEIRPDLSVWWICQLFDAAVWLAWTGIAEGELARKHAPPLAFDSFWRAVGVAS